MAVRASTFDLLRLLAITLTIIVSVQLVDAEIVVVPMRRDTSYTNNHTIRIQQQEIRVVDAFNEWWTCENRWYNVGHVWVPRGSRDVWVRVALMIVPNRSWIFLNANIKYNVHYITFIELDDHLKACGFVSIIESRSCNSGRTLNFEHQRQAVPANYYQFEARISVNCNVEVEMDTKDVLQYPKKGLEAGIARAFDKIRKGEPLPSQLTYIKWSTQILFLTVVMLGVNMLFKRRNFCEREDQLATYVLFLELAINVSIILQNARGTTDRKNIPKNLIKCLVDISEERTLDSSAIEACPTCLICMETFVTGTRVPSIDHECLQRNHFLHNPCLEAWLTRTVYSNGILECPICHKEIRIIPVSGSFAVSSSKIISFCLTNFVALTVISVLCFMLGFFCSTNFDAFMVISVLCFFLGFFCSTKKFYALMVISFISFMLGNVY